MTRCIMHNSDVFREARYWWHAPIGNVLALCVDCCAYCREYARDNPDDRLAQPVRVWSVSR